jgi:hypothetical protein
MEEFYLKLVQIADKNGFDIEMEWPKWTEGIKIDEKEYFMECCAIYLQERLGYNCPAHIIDSDNQLKEQ